MFQTTQICVLKNHEQFVSVIAVFYFALISFHRQGNFHVEKLNCNLRLFWVLQQRKMQKKVWKRITLPKKAGPLTSLSSLWRTIWGAMKIWYSRSLSVWCNNISSFTDLKSSSLIVYLWKHDGVIASLISSSFLSYW